MAVDVKLCEEGHTCHFQLIAFTFLLSSSARVDYVPALCTHRPSLLPIEWLSETSGSASGSPRQHLVAEKLVKLGR